MTFERNTPDNNRRLPEQFLSSLVSLSNSVPGESGPQVATRLLEYLRALGFTSHLTFDLSSPVLPLHDATALAEEIRLFMSGARAGTRRAA